MSEQNTNNTEFTMERAFSLWEAKSKAGNAYYTGRAEDKTPIVAFINSRKESLADPDLLVHFKNEAGEIVKTLNAFIKSSRHGKRYISGTLDGRKVMGFFNEKHTAKQPYINFYYPKDEGEE